MSGNPYLLYGHPLTRSKLVEHVLVELDVAFEARLIDPFVGAHRTPELLAINPTGWIPVLVTPDGEIIAETAAINLTLAERYPDAHLVPPVSDPDRAKFLSTYFYITGM
ncbi:MAG: glutathione S-transferase N-terminal domain-containing protein, partial [Pseudomonadota bacterium]